MSSTEIQNDNMMKKVLIAESMDVKELINSKDLRKDYRTNILNNHQCDEYVFSSNFDSGNLGRVELVRKSDSDNETADNVIHTEFNVWTTPDCYGTPNESPNRTWFFFSIKGGRPYKNVKINVKNLNRQSKLFGQGMQPVFRIGLNGKWERIKNKPTYCMEDEHFSISFIHQTSDNCDIEYFYAFTYPFTYTECQIMLEKFNKKYMKSVRDINFIINKLICTEMNEINSKCAINNRKQIEKGMNDSKLQQQQDENESNKVVIEESTLTIKESNNMDATENASSSSSSNYDTIKESSTDTDTESLYENYTRKQLLNEIYYHRETLINSLEGRKIDLLTITSFHGIQNVRENRLVNLFPDTQYPRCHTFKDKKIIFMSSRVHPGETPASFVLNGFLNLILDKKSIIAQTLRQLYIFKIVPILNPDGVYRGFYRTDTLGQNLNRMYVNPKLEIHPSIYAVKKLIRFYHFGYDNCDPTENLSETSCSSSSRSYDIPIKIENDERKSQTPDIKSDSQSNSCKESTPSSSSEIDNGNISIKSKLHDTKFITTELLETDNTKCKIFTETLIPEIKTCISNESHDKYKKFATVNSNNNNNNNNHNNVGGNNNHDKNLENVKMKKITMKTILNESSSHNSFNQCQIDNKVKKDSHLIKTVVGASPTTSTIQRPLNKRVMIKKDVKSMNTKNGSLSSANNNNNRKVMNRRNILSNHNTNNTNLDISLKSLNTTLPTEKLGSFDENTNMFLYIDFHGHASKKGVFMYGNHFTNSSEAVECMLLPRLMGINCHHFHYDACNFSEKNMYRREKRDGLSKEGSGRVAIFKMTGLIKSYTLESNYNTGKYVNSLPPRGKELSLNHNTTKIINLSPPKYTPAIYEEVGRALGPSILDITNSNVLSRIHNSEYRTIQGLRITLRNEIEKNYSKYSHRTAGKTNTTGLSSSTAVITSTTTSTVQAVANTSSSTIVTTAKALNAQQKNIKRIKRNARNTVITSALPQNDISKENKAILYSIPWDTTTNISTSKPSTSMLLKSKKQNAVSGGGGVLVGGQTKKSQLKLSRRNNNGGNGGGGVIGGCGSSSGKNLKKSTNIKIRSNSVPLLYSTKELPSISKKKSKVLANESSSKKDGTTSTSFYVPSKKVRISNKTNLKGIRKSLLPIPLPSPSSSSSSSSTSTPLQPPSSLQTSIPSSSLSILPPSTSSNFLQKFSTCNTTEIMNCVNNCGVSNNNNNNNNCYQSCQLIDNHHHYQHHLGHFNHHDNDNTSSNIGKILKISIEAQNNVNINVTSSSNNVIIPNYSTSSNNKNNNNNSNNSENDTKYHNFANKEILDYRAIPPSSSKYFMHAGTVTAIATIVTTPTTTTTATTIIASPSFSSCSYSHTATTVNSSNYRKNKKSDTSLTSNLFKSNNLSNNPISSNDKNLNLIKTKSSFVGSNINMKLHKKRIKKKTRRDTIIIKRKKTNKLKSTNTLKKVK